MNRTELFINGQPAVQGMRVTTSRNETGTLDFWHSPHKPSSSGKVYVTINGTQWEYYPSVIGGEFRVPQTQ